MRSQSTLLIEGIGELVIKYAAHRYALLLKKIATSCFIILIFLAPAKADHITGGEMYYSLIEFSNGVYRYHVTLKLFMRCNSGRMFNNPTAVSIFDKVNGNRIMDLSVPLSISERINLANSNTCITNPPEVCYDVGNFNFDVSLPPSANGYIIASQVNYRVSGINNLAPGYSQIGATYNAEIPGTSQGTSMPTNNSAQFIGSDLVIVCANNSFSYSFAATDKDGDELRYSFCDAYQSGTNGNVAAPPPPPPYQAVPYGSNYRGSAPLGSNVQVNSTTGLITGVAPVDGKYVVTVCVEEIRNGVVIATQRKDVQINIASCSIAAATLYPEYMLCKDSMTLAISNLSTSPLINTFNWELVNTSGTRLYSSTDPSISYTFRDTGTYQLRLSINRGEHCSDSTTSLVRVYPGFFPDFDYTGICINKPTKFTDKTTSKFGRPNVWDWDFGESTSTGDFSNDQHPAYTYPNLGIKTVWMIVSNSVGCKDTLMKDVPIVEKPPIQMAFRDSLMCIHDDVQLGASTNGSGKYSWSPNIDIVNSNSPNPTVSPAVTTTYYVDLDIQGCQNRDSVKVRVTDKVFLRAMNDTTICQGDSIRLRIASDGFRYAWTPASQIINPRVANPVAITNITTSYQVTSFIGTCSSTDDVIVTTIPYPLVNAGPDTTICYNTSVRLSGIAEGTITWTPAFSLTDARAINPVASPKRTTLYMLYSYENRGCPKPGIDTVMVAVLPRINPFAGNDTAIVVGQTLQMHSTGGINYKWIPATGLSSPDISSPVAIFADPHPGLRYTVFVYNNSGCVDSAFVTVKVFKSDPSVFVPNAFSPNGDGRNDVLRPIAVGMKEFRLFNIYNRWGQLIFSTQQNGRGWDGSISGRQQSPGVFVWMVKAVDYKGVEYFQKGTVTLIR